MKYPNILYLIESTKFEIDELNNDITKATKIVRQNTITNRLSGKSSHIFFIFSFSTLFAKNRITNIVKATIKNSFHIQIKVQSVPSRPSLNVTNVCKKNCNNNTPKNTLVITTRFFLIRSSIS
jgi:hypothetical protein